VKSEIKNNIHTRSTSSNAFDLRGDAGREREGRTEGKLRRSGPRCPNVAAHGKDRTDNVNFMAVETDTARSRNHREVATAIAAADL